TGLSGGATISLGGSATLSLGVVPIANGGTNLTSAPTASGQYLRSSGAGTWSIGTIATGDLPHGDYVDMATNQTIGGNKTFSNTISANITGNAGSVNNGVYTTSSIANPSFITSLDGA